MKQQVTFEYEGNSYTVEVERRGDNLVIESEGHSYEVTLSGAVRPRPTLATAGAAASTTGGAQPSTVAAASGTPPAAAPAPAPAAASAGPAAGSAAPGDVVAPMTGTIREIRTSVGAAVTEGQVLFVMEAMKMDLEVPVAVAGTVSEIAVAAGDSVVEAQLLARVSG